MDTNNNKKIMQNNTTLNLIAEVPTTIIVEEPTTIKKIISSNLCVTFPKKQYLKIIDCYLDNLIIYTQGNYCVIDITSSSIEMIQFLDFSDDFVEYSYIDENNNCLRIELAPEFS